MKQPSTMMQLFDKLNDLNSVFVYGQKVIPVVQSLIDFMKDTVPLLDNINSSISESTNKIPKATDHINDVTNATELATTEILDIVDQISDELAIVEKWLQEMVEKENNLQIKLEKLGTIIGDNQKGAELLKEIKGDLFIKNSIDPIISKISDVKSDTYNITLSLQVQDITTQQLAAVNHLIESVQNKLASLITDLNHKDIHDFDYEISSDAHFNPGAKYSKDTDNQDLADSLIEEKKSKTSQEEIDKLFQ